MTLKTSNAYLTLIQSDRVGANTRDALLKRIEPDQPGILTPEQMTILRSLLDRVLPQPDHAPIDLATRIDQQLAAKTGDGWRRAELPFDVQAYATGLTSLNIIAQVAHSQPFAGLHSSQQDEILQHLVAGNLPPSPAPFSIDQLQRWFEDLRADATRHYVAHPATLERMGYSGIANGGDGQPKSGFVRLGLDPREDWEPVPNPRINP